ncbi:MAG TPA: DUF481 domain-containing protein [Vicinamibacterales bacterium]|nr:DUF481 domain-containing protein [Vicinamibacterales bacterium]
MIVSLFIFVFLFIASPAWCQPKTDVVTLGNGDRITGEITSLSRGRLALKTDDAGTINFEWDKVRRVESTRLFEIETSDGRRLLGSLSSPADRQIAIGVMDNPLILAMDDVTRLTAIGASFWSKLEGSVNAGFSYSHSAQLSQITFNQDAIYRRPAFQFRMASSATLTQQEDTEDDNRASLSADYVRYRGLRWFIASGGRLESNQSLGLVLRSQLGATAGQRLVNTNRAQFEVGGGVVFNNEQAVDDSESTQNLEAVFMANTSYYTYDSPKTTIDFKTQYYPSFSQKGRQRVQIDSSFNRELYKDLTLTFSVFYTFDSKPPKEGAARTDVGVVTSLGWTFGR